MQSFCKNFPMVRNYIFNAKIMPLKLKPFTRSSVSGANEMIDGIKEYSECIGLSTVRSKIVPGLQTRLSTCQIGIRLMSSSYKSPRLELFQTNASGLLSTTRLITTSNLGEEIVQTGSNATTDITPRIKFKRLDKTARHIMQILDKESVGKVRSEREIEDVKPGYIVQLKVEVPENKRRVSIVKGIVIARRNAGLHTTFRLRRMVAGVGVESVFPLYSPNIKEMKVLDKKKVRRAKLYYLRDKMNALKK